MGREMARGIPVVHHRFHDSGHVNHFRLYPEQYGNLILNFIATIYKDNLENNLR